MKSRGSKINSKPENGKSEAWSSVFSSALVYIVDDDPSVRRGLSQLIESAGFIPRTFASAEEFLNRKTCNNGGCIILDVRMPGLTGLDLQEALSKTGSMPIIFISGHGDIPMSVRAMKKGAVDFLTKPFDDKDLLDAVKVALQRDEEARQHRARVEDAWSRIATLTHREREVMKLVVSGTLNKQIAGKLEISERTVKAHRSQVMSKMGAESVADLIRFLH